MKVLQVLFLLAASQNGKKKKNKKNKNTPDSTVIHPNYCDYFDLDCEAMDDSAENRIQRQICCEGYNVTTTAVPTTKKPTTITTKRTTKEPTKRPWSDRLTCFHCDAKNMDECMATGYYKECDYNEQSCMIEARHRGGRTEQVRMLCKQPLACQNNKAQNFGRNRQCRPESKRNNPQPSVCRQCCYESGCTDFFNPLSSSAWRKAYRKRYQ
ncbi:Oidioi.mRNA.OKI2018_I69.PAR.g10515.t1.cds [Oikopleura dioica]|uniref:Oidioi.mRNA.OKI2018_I69.PAR.g10515.t1.cds n=1 Tax=Oikopleura dioica TaxID=34765 RepID=A0ABN7RRV5_OIKDI|nr:Oidioi.mRNA.OKI2018_I69.PAR.g10515.t1.cds [Oikopleura dioica]